MSAVVSDVVFDLLAPDAPAVPVNVELSYSPCDPYAVQAALRRGPTDRVVWVFARDLLFYGLSAPAGIGDVRVLPEPGSATRVLLEVSSPDGHAVFSVDAEELAAFLSRTYDAVPDGSEWMWLELDALVARLLGEESSAAEAAWMRNGGAPGYWICRFGAMHKGPCTCPQNGGR